MTNHDTNMHDKITQIMELAGVLPGDLDRSRKNFERLPKEEIDRRLDDLRGAALRVERWRRSWRNTPQAAPASRATPAADERADPVFVDSGDVIKAVAALENEVSDLNPPMIISVNREGTALAKAIRADLHLRPEIFEISAGPAKGISFIDEPHPLPKNAVVVVLGHYVSSGRTMAAVADYVRDRFALNRIQCLALAASPAGAEWVNAHNPLFFYLDPHESATLSHMGSDQISLTDLDTFPKEIVAAIKRTREQLPTIRNSLRKAGVGRR